MQNINTVTPEFRGTNFQPNTVAASETVNVHNSVIASDLTKLQNSLNECVQIINNPTIQEIDGTIQAIQNDINGHQNDINTIQNDISRIHNDISGIQTEIDNGTVDGSVIQGLQNDINGLQNDISVIQTDISGKADKTYVDNKVKTDVPAGAKFTDTVYTHPTSHPASMITQDTNNRFVTDAEKAVWNNPPASGGKKVARFVVGTSTAGWTAADCDYLCDGTADQTEINAAITALPATGGEVVILDGTYNITAKIDVTKDNVSIRGNGNATILKRMFNSSDTEGVITLTGRSGCKIANLQIDGNRTSYTNNNDSGIYLNASSNCAVTGNTCNNNEDGIYLKSASDDNTVTGNTCNNNRYGINLRSANNNTVTGNTCNNNEDGFYLYAARYCAVTGNTCNNNEDGIYVYSSSNCAVTGNTCNNNEDGIYLNASSNCAVTGNTCIRGTGLAADYTSSQDTIRLNATGNSYNLIAMNNCMGKAVTNGGGTGNTLVYNKFNAT